MTPRSSILVLAKVLRFATTAPSDLLTFVLEHPDPPPPLVLAALSRPELTNDQVEHLTRHADRFDAPEAVALAAAVRVTAATTDAHAGIRAAQDILNRDGDADTAQWQGVLNGLLNLYGQNHPLLAAMASSTRVALLQAFLASATFDCSANLVATAVIGLDRQVDPTPFSDAATEAAESASGALRRLAQEPPMLLSVLEQVRNPHTVYEIACRQPDNAWDLPGHAWELVARRGLLPLLQVPVTQWDQVSLRHFTDGLQTLRPNWASVSTTTIHDLVTALTARRSEGADADRSWTMATRELSEALEARLHTEGLKLPFPARTTTTDVAYFDQRDPIVDVADWVSTHLDNSPDRWHVLLSVMDALDPHTPLVDVVTTANGVS